MKLRVKERCLLGCSKSSNEGESNVYLEDGTLSGIIAGHAYGILDAFEITDTNGN
jgi:hypothetical protein